MPKTFTVKWLNSTLWILLISSNFILKADQVNLQNLSAPNMMGVPSIIHYNRSDFNADPQFWTMCQDKEGIIYFGNNDGALIFDGETWQKVFLPNGSSVRSLHYSESGEVFAGGFNEFGKIERNEFGVYHFESLTELLNPENQNFESVWDIQELNGKIVFRTFRMLYIFENGKFTLVPADQAFTFSSNVDGKLFIQDNNRLKLLDLNGLNYKTLLVKEQLQGEDLVAVLPGGKVKDQVVLITKQGSLYSLNLDDDELKFIERIIPLGSNNLITCGLKTSEKRYVFGTLSSNILIRDENGEKINVDQAFDQLQDQTVLNIYETKEGNIWALLNNGIDCIDLNSPVTSVFDKASVYDVKMAHGNIYVASNQGVYLAKSNLSPSFFSKLDFKKIEGMEGQTWTIQLFENQILASHDKGVFVIKDNGERYTIPGITGIWKIIPIDGSGDKFFACAYDGLFLLKFNSKDNRFELVQKVEGFGESSRDILQDSDPNIIWVCHGYKGVYRLRLNEEFTRVTGLEHFKDQNGLPSPFSINVFDFLGETVFTTNNGIFRYDETQKKFNPVDKLDRVFGKELNVRNLQVKGNRLWFVQDDEAGYVSIDANGNLNSDENRGLFLRMKGEFNRSMECIYPVDERLVMMGTRKGLFAFDLTYGKSNLNHQVLFRKVTFQKGEEELLGSIFSNEKTPLELPNNTTNLKVEFAIPSFDDQKEVQYSYLLEGVGLGWSTWEEKAFVDFNYLKSGKYALLVKARSRVGEISEVNSFYFTILPKWYQTGLAFVSFAILAVLTLFMVIFFVRKKISIEKEKARIDQTEKTKVLELQIHQMKLENEKRKIEKDKEILEEDILSKSKELANYTMLLVRKKELLNELNEELSSIKEVTINEKVRSRLRKIQTKINSNLRDEEYLKVFDINFERVHQAFFDELKTAYPYLTPKELRLCAFVKMNLTNKEIASILNISVRGIETARYRLKKRLSLDHAVNMVEFLDSLSHLDIEEEESEQD
ncbi:hypothetical protein MM236_15685 [Belliella sp. DSM 107340]|uniref:HTH luxR-type domain-containing protein n=1 Tax=Belliella calami TaxID=2923436 RepID=A0ABS9USN4_9BACT|nr:hypothetical protein [Belliella calami]MCH7399444.1 hypothetical protein [Belliella calami]